MENSAKQHKPAGTRSQAVASIADRILPYNLQQTSNWRLLLNSNSFSCWGREFDLYLLVTYVDVTSSVT